MSVGPPSDLLDLRDGRRVRIRPLRAGDEPLLHEAFSRMSERSVYFRFFSPLKRLPEDMARRLARVDSRERYALAAVTREPDGLEHVVGVARYDRVPGTNVAEVAVAVIDEYQHLGLGSGLLRRLAQVAREQGLERFVLIVLPENVSMLGLLRRMGWMHEARLEGGVYEITFPLGQ
jgi:ribosomal protein S18 acetylase RimI-like enzyme